MLFYHCSVIGLRIDGPDHAKRHRVFRKRHSGEPVVNTGVGFMCVMGKDILLGNAVLPKGYHLKLEIFQDDSLVAVFAEDHLFAMAESDCIVITILLARESIMSSVIEDDAVLDDLNYCSAMEPGCLLVNLVRELQVIINRACEETAIGAYCEFSILKGSSIVPYGEVFVVRPFFEVGEYCPLVRP